MMQLTPQERFDFAVKRVIKHEGGFANNPKDPGGATQYGISLRFLKEMGIDLNNDDLIDLNDIKEIHFTDAVDIYKKYFWDKYHYEAINSLAMATKILDMAVNVGPREAHKIVQRSLGYTGYSDIIVDGILGLKTIGAINEVTLSGREADLMWEICYYQKYFYVTLVEEHPDLNVFLKGWLARASYQGT